MTALYSDIYPEIKALQIQIWWQTSPTRKMNLLKHLNEFARLLAFAGLRTCYPQATELKLRRRLGDLPLGEELARYFGRVEYPRW